MKWPEVMFYKEESVVYDYFEENLKKEEKKDMALADLIPGAIKILKDEGRIVEKRSLIIKLLTKKLNERASESILELIENADINELEKVEDRIFEIESWSDVRELICN